MNNQFCSGCGKSLMGTMRICPYCGGKSFSNLPPSIPLPTQRQNVTASAASLTGAQVRPWVRYWARMLDICVLSFPIGLLLGIFAPHFVTPKSNDALLGIVALFFYIFVEALLLSSFGTTPGKWLFKIQLAHTSGNPISYSQAMTRALKVWWRGLGIGFPIVGLITNVIAYERLKRYGITSWDREGDFVVAHEKIGIARILIAVVIFIVFFFVIFAINEAPRHQYGFLGVST